MTKSCLEVKVGATNEGYKKTTTLHSMATVHESMSTRGSFDMAPFGGLLEKPGTEVSYHRSAQQTIQKTRGCGPKNHFILGQV